MGRHAKDADLFSWCSEHADQAGRPLGPRVYNVNDGQSAYRQYAFLQVSGPVASFYFERLASSAAVESQGSIQPRDIAQRLLA